MIYFADESTLEKLKDTWQINITIAIISGFIGFFLKRCHIRYQIKRQARMNAAIEFRSAFTDALVSLSTKAIIQKSVIDNNFADTTVNQEIAKHRAAFVRYKTYLSWWGKIRLQIAWHKYSDKKASNILQKKFGDYSETEVMCYTATRDKKRREREFTIKNELQVRKLARKRIEKLLKII